MVGRPSPPRPGVVAGGHATRRATAVALVARLGTPRHLRLNASHPFPRLTSLPRARPERRQAMEGLTIAFVGAIAALVVAFIERTDRRSTRRFDAIDRRFDQTDRRFERIDTRFDGVDG